MLVSFTLVVLMFHSLKSQNILSIDTHAVPSGTDGIRCKRGSPTKASAQEIFQASDARDPHARYSEGSGKTHPLVQLPWRVLTAPGASTAHSIKYFAQEMLEVSTPLSSSSVAHIPPKSAEEA